MYEHSFSIQSGCLNVVTESHEIGHHFQKSVVRPTVLLSYMFDEEMLHVTL